MNIEEQKFLYNQWITSCKSFHDVDSWFKQGFKFSAEREEECWREIRSGTLPPRVLKPYEVFSLKSGCCLDITWFTGKSLSLINSSYNIKYNTIVTIRFKLIHTLVTFTYNSKLYTIDYSFPETIPAFKAMCGLWGPFDSLDSIVKDFYLKMNPKYKNVDYYHEGWPDLRDYVAS
jgi:hypothetical protein